MLRKLRLTVIFFLLSTFPAFADISNGLVGWWRFDDGSGATATDSSSDFGATGNNGTLTNSPSWVTGKYGDALNFNGSTQYVTSATLTGLPTGSSARSSSAWIKYSDTTGGYRAITDYGTYIKPERWGFYLYSSSGAKVIDFISYSNDVSSNGTVPADGAWHFVAATYDGSTTVKFYIDGSLDSTKTLGSQLNTVLGADPFSIGKGSDESVYFNGTIDDVRIYNRALSAGEVWDLYEGGTQNTGGE